VTGESVDTWDEKGDAPAARRENYRGIREDWITTRNE
jgi:hypothetical protein